MAADVIELARRHDEAFNSQDPEGRTAIEASDVEVMYPGGLVLRGHEQVLQLVRAFWNAIPDGKINVDTQLASGDVVFAEGTLTGTHTGAFRTPEGEIPASGKPVTVRYATMKRFREGKLVSEHLYFDQLEFLQQLGAMA
jgi:steroid delta-isomerase-like uncharacterized protein